jgi:hypothetical protein
LVTTESTTPTPITSSTTISSSTTTSTESTTQTTETTPTETTATTQSFQCDCGSKPNGNYDLTRPCTGKFCTCSNGFASIFVSIFFNQVF